MRRLISLLVLPVCLVSGAARAQAASEDALPQRQPSDSRMVAVDPFGELIWPRNRDAVPLQDVLPI